MSSAQLVCGNGPLSSRRQRHAKVCSGNLTRLCRGHDELCLSTRTRIASICLPVDALPQLETDLPPAPAWARGVQNPALLRAILPKNHRQPSSTARVDSTTPTNSSTPFFFIPSASAKALAEPKGRGLAQKQQACLNRDLWVRQQTRPQLHKLPAHVLKSRLSSLLTSETTSTSVSTSFDARLFQLWPTGCTDSFMGTMAVRVDRWLVFTPMLVSPNKCAKDRASPFPALTTAQKARQATPP